MPRNGNWTPNTVYQFQINLNMKNKINLSKDIDYFHLLDFNSSEKFHTTSINSLKN